MSVAILPVCCGLTILLFLSVHIHQLYDCFQFRSYWSMKYLIPMILNCKKNKKYGQMNRQTDRLTTWSSITPKPWFWGYQNKPLYYWYVVTESLQLIKLPMISVQSGAWLATSCGANPRPIMLAWVAGFILELEHVEPVGSTRINTSLKMSTYRPFRKYCKPLAEQPISNFREYLSCIFVGDELV